MNAETFLQVDLGSGAVATVRELAPGEWCVEQVEDWDDRIPSEIFPARIERVADGLEAVRLMRLIDPAIESWLARQSLV